MNTVLRERERERESQSRDEIGKPEKEKELKYLTEVRGGTAAAR